MRRRKKTVGRPKQEPPNQTRATQRVPRQTFKKKRVQKARVVRARAPPISIRSPTGKEKVCVGVVDTMFSRGDMGTLAKAVLLKSHRPVKIVRRTVPGIKDLPVAAKKLIDEEQCEIVITLGMVGRQPIDKTCAHEAVQGIQWAQLLTNTPILDVMVHEDEAHGDDEKLAAIMADRVIKHARNALDLLFDPKSLVRRAGTGQRQGGTNEREFKLPQKTLDNKGI